MRPPPLKMPIIPTREAAAAGVMPMVSCAMGDASDRSPIPQVILTKKTHHRALNCHVFIASLASIP